MMVQIRNGEQGFLTETSTFVYKKNLKGCVYNILDFYY